jgi:hypothetical protein
MDIKRIEMTVDRCVKTMINGDLKFYIAAEMRNYVGATIASVGFYSDTEIPKDTKIQVLISLN